MLARAARPAAVASRGPAPMRTLAPSPCARTAPRRQFSSTPAVRQQSSGHREQRSHRAPPSFSSVMRPTEMGFGGAGFGLAAGLAVVGVSIYTLANDDDVVEAKEDVKKTAAAANSGNEPRLPAKFLGSLKALLGDRLVTEFSARAAHGKDFSYHAAGDPEAVLFPLTSEEVQAIARLCSEFNVAIVPYGSGTSLEGHTAPISDGVVTVDFSKMNKVLRVNMADLDAVVQPGVQYEILNEELKQYGLFFPLDPGPHASIGGMVGTSCSGTNAVRYGTMKENVISLKAVLADGSFVSTGRRSKKKSAGYDLTHLFIGAEGTLGLVTEITIRLHKIPEQRSVAVCNFKSIEDAANTVMAMMQKGVRIGRVELLDDSMMKAVNQHANFSYPLQPHLFFEFSGTPAEVHDQIAAVEALSKEHKGGAFKFATEGAEREQLWRARKEAFWAASVLRPGADTMTTDVCVPVSRLAECIHDTRQDIAKSKLIAPLVGHVGDGNFHLFVMVDSSNPKELEQAHAFNDRLVRRAINMEGTCSGEHGVGTGKMSYLPEELGPEAVQLMKTIKKAIDPKNILNPGKVVNLTDPLNRGHEYGK